MLRTSVLRVVERDTDVVAARAAGRPRAAVCAVVVVPHQHVLDRLPDARSREAKLLKREVLISLQM